MITVVRQCVTSRGVFPALLNVGLGGYYFILGQCGMVQYGWMVYIYVAR